MKLLALFTLALYATSANAGTRCGYSHDHAAQFCGDKCGDDSDCKFGMRCWHDLATPDCGAGTAGADTEAAAAVAAESGFSTRYWDCSKPTCSWGHGVKFCARDGKTELQGAVQSGATGGTAYACDVQQPFTAGDDLGYGFVAASDPRLCCACFELTFTDTAVAGKRMVVQVINTGPTDPRHFDIAIPGGGIGFSDGCTPQFGDTGAWGAQGGGVSDRAHCYGLPEQLWPGCLWRFGWFQNADNPAFERRPVRCPRELTERSGC